ncbi:hypothetical protein Noda2021_09730 [Candidatus Dependentiae bacterium Noda2021]|nr:hypothetical protein Noda2021_09730 [Candidatus Dependentiae bacterium Noda2021]
MIYQSILLSLLLCMFNSFCSENTGLSQSQSVKTKRKNSLNAEKRYEVTQITYDNNKSHFSVEITPPNSPESLARAYIKPHETNASSCSVKISARPNIHVIEELANQLKKNKHIKKLRPDSLSVEFQNLSNDADESNTELSNIMHRLMTKCFDNHEKNYALNATI